MGFFDAILGRPQPKPANHADPFALPPGVATDTLILTSTDLRGRAELAGCRVLPYQEAATEAGVFAPVCQCTGD